MSNIVWDLLQVVITCAILCGLISLNLNGRARIPSSCLLLQMGSDPCRISAPVHLHATKIAMQLLSCKAHRALPVPQKLALRQERVYMESPFIICLYRNPLGCPLTKPLSRNALPSFSAPQDGCAALCSFGAMI